MKKHGITLLMVLFAMVIFLSANCILTTQAASVDDLTYHISNGKVTITGCNSDASGKLIIPDTIEGYPVTTIRYHAFKDCTSLTSVTIGNSVTSIGDWAFCRCEKLTSVTFPNSLTSIGSSAFEDCTSLTSVTFGNSVTSIGDWAFCRCEKLTSVTFPNSLTSIGSSAFRGCDSLTSVTIPDSVTGIGDRAFDDCNSLNLVTIGNGVTSIEYNTFDDCDSLTSVTMGDSVTKIGYGAFIDCENLSSVTLPKSLTYVAALAFTDCNRLANVYYTGTQKQWDQIDIASENDPLLRAVLHTNYVPFRVTKQPVDKYLPAGQTAKFTVKATGVGLKYQWQYRPSAKDSWKNASATGNKTTSLSIPATGTRNGYQYRCKITDKNGKVLYSSVATLRIVTLKVKAQPANKYLPAGKTAKFTVKASGTGLKYQWQYRTSPKGSWKTASATGNKTATLSVSASASKNGFQYRCKITDQYGNVIYSNAATLKIVTLKITTQPSSVTLAKGKTATFKVVAKGTGITYQWQYRTSAKGAWKKAAATGNKTATLKVPATATKNGFQYRCVITDKYGNVMYSKAVTLNVK